MNISIPKISTFIIFILICSLKLYSQNINIDNDAKFKVDCRKL